MAASRSIIAVAPAAALHARPRLFASLAAALDLDFAPWSGERRPVAGIVAVGVPVPVEAAGLPAFLVASPDTVGAADEDVRVLDGGLVDRRLWSTTLAGTLAGAAPEAGEGAEILAIAAHGVVWTRRGDAQRIRAILPELPAGEVLRDVLLYRKPVCVVALLAFLRELTRPEGRMPPPLRASIVFDDPNLRWRSYGYIDYGRLLEHADEHDYHVAMAMIPLDAVRPHRGTVELFRRHSNRLSLVYHGNDHIKRELMVPPMSAAADALAAQAIRRVSRFEHQHGVRVDRVMMPPHGLCSEVMTAALGRVGFDALSAIHPLPWTERPPIDHLPTGMAPAQFVRGCAVIPRFPLDCPPAELGLRAFLDQPLIFYGHHDDLADGLEPLARAAHAARRLGPVEWMSVGELALSNYTLRVDGARASVRPHARRVRVTLPAGVEQLLVSAPGDALAPSPLTGWTADGVGGELTFADALPVQGTPVTVRLRGRADVDPTTVAPPAWRAWPRVRRAAAEVRDRAQPLRFGRAG